MFTSILDNGIFQVLTILFIFTGVGFIAYIIRKHFYKLPWEDKPVDPKQALKEEIDRVLVPIKDPLVAKDEAAKTVAPTETKKPQPTKKTVAKKTVAKKTSSTKGPQAKREPNQKPKR
jgi:hypothetical protein